MEYVYIGKIVNTHGIKGEVRLISNFERKDLVFKKNFKIYIGSLKKEEIVNSYRIHKNYDMITLNGINDINDVLKYNGEKVYVNRDDLKLNNQEYLIDDLLGLAVICDGKEYGIIKDIYDTKGSKLILISYNDKDIFIPFVEEFIKQVDVNNKRVIVERIREFL